MPGVPAKRRRCPVTLNLKGLCGAKASALPTSNSDTAGKSLGRTSAKPRRRPVGATAVEQVGAGGVLPPTDAQLPKSVQP
eukprot:3351951-Alexandrium_andersonii.AAC.1